MSKGAIADAVVAELRKLRPGEAGDMAALKAAIGCGADELRCAIDRLRFSGKLGFYGLVLSASMRDEPAEPPGEVASQAGFSAPEAPVAEPPPAPVIEVKPQRVIEARPDRAPLGDRRFKRYRQAAAAPAAPTGPELGAEIRAYCREHGVGPVAFSLAVTGHASLLGNCEASAHPRRATVDQVRAFIASHPNGISAAEACGQAPAVEPAAVLAPVDVPRTPDLREQVREEAEASVARRRQAARVTGQCALELQRAPDPALRGAVEAIQLEAAATPHDLIVAISRRHPALIARAAALGRARRTTPASAIYSALEAGLDQYERETRNGG